MYAIAVNIVVLTHSGTYLILRKMENNKMQKNHAIVVINARMLMKEHLGTIYLVGLMEKMVKA